MKIIFTNEEAAKIIKAHVLKMYSIDTDIQTVSIYNDYTGCTIEITEIEKVEEKDEQRKNT